MKQRLSLRLARTVDSAVRLLILAVILPIAARVMSYDSGRVFCRALALPLILSPVMLVRWRGVCHAHGVSALKALRILWAVEAAKFFDGYGTYHWSAGIVRPEHWQVTEKNGDQVRALREAGRPFVIATGHFVREAMSGLFLAPHILPGQILAVVASTRPTIYPSVARGQVALNAILQTLATVRPGVELFYAGSSLKSMAKLVARLKQPRTVAVIAVDAYSERSSYRVRSFAGEGERSVAAGAAVLARLSGCPIVPCVPVLVGPRQIEIEWGPAIPAPERHDKAADARIIDHALAFIERAIGERPEQYVGAIAYEMRWNNSTRSWDERADRLPSIPGLPVTAGLPRSRDD